MYLDLDVHFGDGVAAAFHRPGRGRSGASSNILTLSIHYAAPGFFPKNPLADLPRPLEENDDGDRDWDPYTLSVPLGIGTSCVTMARIWRSVVEAVRSAFAPDFLVIQCGADGLAGDPCGVWNWSSGGEGDGSTPEDGSMGWCVQQACSWGCKVLLTGGGGQCKHPASSVILTTL
jgi:histone deacetylase 8